MIIIAKIRRLIITVFYLKSIQIYMRIFYIIRKKIRKITGFKYPKSLKISNENIKLSFFFIHPTSYENKSFTFLNLSTSFLEEIDWNYKDNGKLWTYNLTYFEYLHQLNITKEEGIKLIYNFIDQSNQIKDGLEPFPISLRGINWIKFLSRNKIIDYKINASLYAQYMILLDNLEYHILGNHLLENGFSLLFGAYYFQNEQIYIKAKEILIKELKEQILDDGAHFELTPMYHQIMLYRILDCINLLQNNSWKNKGLLTLLVGKAKIMLGWLNTLTFSNGKIPLFNDSTECIAPTTKELNNYAAKLNVKIQKQNLNDSGYRKIDKKHYEVIVDIGNIGPDYIPGHAHSDTFNFELYIDRKPFIVDTGLSTYENNTRRILERSTVSHNTVELEKLNQSEVWGSFRVANRAYIIKLEETNHFIRAVHNGYKKRLDALHQREFLFDNKKIKIIDTIISEKEYKAIARLHFYPGIEPIIINDGVQIDNIKIKIGNEKFYGEENLRFKIKEYNYAPEFNKLIKAKMLEIPFIKKLKIEIIL